MATPSQLAANRANARQSTGPRTAEGKSASSGNGFKSGIYATSLIVRGEDPAELDALRDGFYDIYAPEAADERGLVDTLIASEWTLRRLRKCTAQIWENAFGASEELRDSASQPSSPMPSPITSRTSSTSSASSTPPTVPSIALCWTSSASKSPDSPRNPLNPNPHPRNWLRSCKTRLRALLPPSPAHGSLTPRGLRLGLAWAR